MSITTLLRSPQSDFNAMIRDLPLEKKWFIETNIQTIAQENLALLQNLLSSFSTTWNHDLFLNDQAPFVFLKALKEGVISSRQCMSLSLFHEAYQQKRASSFIECYHLTHNRDAIKLLQSSYNQSLDISVEKDLTSKPEYWKLLSRGSIGLLSPYFHLALSQVADTLARTSLSEEQETLFLHLIDHLESSEQCFFVMDNIVFEDDDDSLLQQIASEEVAVYGFMKTIDNKVLIVSIGILESYLKAKFGKASSSFDLMLGLSSLKTVREGLPHKQRPLSLLPSYLNIEANPHDYKAPGEQILLHDFYHHLVLSSIPTSHLHYYRNMVDLLREEAKKETHPDIKKKLYALSWKINDTDFAVYDATLRKALWNLCQSHDQNLLILTALERIYYCLQNEMNQQEESLMTSSFGFKEFLRSLFKIKKMKQSLKKAHQVVMRHVQKKLEASLVVDSNIVKPIISLSKKQISQLIQKTYLQQYSSCFVARLYHFYQHKTF